MFFEITYIKVVSFIWLPTYNQLNDDHHEPVLRLSTSEETPIVRNAESASRRWMIDHARESCNDRG